MDGGTSTTGATPEWQSAMIDVSGLSLTELADLADLADRANRANRADLARAQPTAGTPDDSALAHCLRRLADDLARPGEPIAGFNSAL